MHESCDLKVISEFLRSSPLVLCHFKIEYDRDFYAFFKVGKHAILFVTLPICRFSQYFSVEFGRNVVGILLNKTNIHCAEERSEATQIPARYTCGKLKSISECPT